MSLCPIRKPRWGQAGRRRQLLRAIASCSACPQIPAHQSGIQGRDALSFSPQGFLPGDLEKIIQVCDLSPPEQAPGAEESTEAPEVLLLFSVTKSCLTLFSLMGCSTPGFPVPHCLSEFPQILVHNSVMPPNCLILCHPLFLLPSIFPSIRVFSNELALPTRWPKYRSFSFSISSSREYWWSYWGGGN